MRFYRFLFFLCITRFYFFQLFVDFFSSFHSFFIYFFDLYYFYSLVRAGWEHVFFFINYFFIFNCSKIFANVIFVYWAWNYWRRLLDRRYRFNIFLERVCRLILYLISINFLYFRNCHFWWGNCHFFWLFNNRFNNLISGW